MIFSCLLIRINKNIFDKLCSSKFIELYYKVYKLKLTNSFIYFEFRAKSFPRGCKNCLLRVRWNDWRKTFILKNLFSCHFWTLSKSFGHLARVFRKVFETVIHVSRETFWGKFFPRKLNCSPFSEIERKFFGLLMEVFWQSCRNCILPFRRKISGKVIFFGNLFISFGIWAFFGLLMNVFRHGCQNCILVFRRTLWCFQKVVPQTWTKLADMV